MSIPEESEYLLFEELYASGKTKKVKVLEKQYGTTLGIIKWQWQWKQYAFFVNTGAEERVFDMQSLSDIGAVIALLMGQRPKKKL
jgi:hypothetical protein